MLNTLQHSFIVQFHTTFKHSFVRGYFLPPADDVESERVTLVLEWDAVRRRSSLRSFASFSRCASSFWYSAASSRFFVARRRFCASRCRLRCSTTGVTRRWIFGAFVVAFLPAPNAQYTSHSLIDNFANKLQTWVLTKVQLLQMDHATCYVSKFMLFHEVWELERFHTAKPTHMVIQWCNSIGNTWFPIRRLLQPCQRSRDLNTSLLMVIYHSRTSTPLYQAAHTTFKVPSFNDSEHTTGGKIYENRSRDLDHAH